MHKTAKKSARSIKPSSKSSGNAATKKLPSIKTQASSSASLKRTWSLLREHKVVAIADCVIIVLVVLFVFRGWLRMTIVPSLATHVYQNNVKSEVATQNTDLQHPLAKLGIMTSSNQFSCNLEYAQGIHTEIDCQSTVHGYTKLPQTASRKLVIETNAQHLQTLLRSQGWHDGTNGVTITSLVDSTYEGKDYSADAYYEKVVGSNDCVFDTMIAYANPSLSAINSSLWCDRTANILGTPNGEFYTSSKGTGSYN